MKVHISESHLLRVRWCRSRPLCARWLGRLRRCAPAARRRSCFDSVWSRRSSRLWRSRCRGGLATGPHLACRAAPQLARAAVLAKSELSNGRCKRRQDSLCSSCSFWGPDVCGGRAKCRSGHSCRGGVLPGCWCRSEEGAPGVPRLAGGYLRAASIGAGEVDQLLRNSLVAHDVQSFALRKAICGVHDELQ